MKEIYNIELKSQNVMLAVSAEQPTGLAVLGRPVRHRVLVTHRPV